MTVETIELDTDVEPAKFIVGRSTDAVVAALADSAATVDVAWALEVLAALRDRALAKAARRAAKAAPEPGPDDPA